MHGFTDSIVIIQAAGTGSYTTGIGFNFLTIFSPGLKEPAQIRVQDLKLFVSNEIGRGTSLPCYSAAHQMIGFSSEESLVYYLKLWRIGLDLIQPETNQAPKVNRAATAMVTA
ncbi:MAG: hypothetical protein NTZ49_03570 [Candidatus Parcubacteria bacterium]|nr:hypothetical protein [Candidatus Parcubacteria bacterium]